MAEKKRDIEPPEGYGFIAECKLYVVALLLLLIVVAGGTALQLKNGPPEVIHYNVFNSFALKGGDTLTLYNLALEGNATVTGSMYLSVVPKGKELSSCHNVILEMRHGYDVKVDEYGNHIQIYYPAEADIGQLRARFGEKNFTFVASPSYGGKFNQSLPENSP